MSANESKASAPAPGGMVRNVVFGLVVVAAILAGRSFLLAYMNRQAEPPEKGKPPAVNVALATAAERRFAEVARTQGTLLARDYALVSPRSESLIMTLPVREGDWVEKDKTVLFTMDDLVLHQNVEAAERNLDVARFTLAEKVAAEKKDQADHVKAEKDWKRAQELFENNSYSESQLDTFRATFDKAVAQKEYAASLVQLAQSQIKVAETSLVKARKDLDDAVVRAPLSGFVTLRALEPGQNAKPGETVVRIDDPRLLEATGYLAGRHYPRIVAESQRAVVRTLAANPRTNGHGIPELPDPESIPLSKVTLYVEGAKPKSVPLTYKAPAVDQGLRTFKIKADMQGDGHLLVPGLLVDMAVEMRVERGVGVPKTALAERNGKPVVFVVDADGGTARMVEVERGIETNDWVQVTAPAIRAGVRVVDGGAALAQLDEGSPVHVTRETPPPAPDAEDDGDEDAPPAPSAPVSLRALLPAAS